MVIFKKIILILIALCIGGIIGGYIYLSQTISTPYSKEKNFQTIVITKGMTTPQIADQMKISKLIHSSTAFSLYIKVMRIKLKPGQYTFSSNQPPTEMLDRITSGDIDQEKVTFPEGWTIKQMAERLVAKKVIKSKDLFIDAAAGQEGYLFPDTYFFALNASPKVIIKTMRDNFTKRTNGTTATPDVVILASIIEREAKKDEDRPIIASVYANRLKTGMRLEADPTVQYAKGSWESITVSDYQLVYSPYNTYLHAGFPPGPICNPGLKSIEGAANPAKTDYFYFIQTADGTTYYAKTLAEHQANIKKYLR